MFEAFRLKGSVGGDMSVDLDDTLATKQALHSLGHFRTPSYGLTEYPDRPMIDGLKSFQRANGLKVDGVMRPDGPTMRKLDAALVAREDISPPRPPKRAIPPIATPTPTGTRPPVKLKQPVKASASVDLDDALKVKTTLADLGLLRPPKDGFSPYPDRAMFDAVEAFQRRAGLRVDGEMAPDGPTVRKLNAALQAKTAAEEESQIRRHPSTADGTQVAQAVVPPGTLPVVPGAGGAGGTPDAVGGLPPSYRYRAPDIDWAETWSRLPEEVQSRLLQVGSLPLATKTLLEELATNADDSRSSPTRPAPAARTRIAEPLPPVPPSEPPRDKDKLPDRTELPPDAGTLPSTEVRPIVDDELRDMIDGYPDQSDDELMQGSILESRGGPEVKARNWLAARRTPKRLAKYGFDIEELGGSIEQIGGSRTPKPDSDRRTEKWYMAEKNRRAARTDITWRVRVPGQKNIHVDLQTVTTYADGVTPKPHETDAGMRVTAYRDEHEQRGFVVNVPKGVGMRRKEWVETHLEPAIEKIAKRLKRMVENNDMK